MSNLTMSLLENSKDFFEESIQKAITAETNKKDWKFAILFLVQAIETSLKEVLYRENQILIYSNIDKPKFTVDIGLALERLVNICKLNLNPEDKKSIEVAYRMRNEIVHYQFDYPIEQMQSMYTKLAGFYSSFCLEVLKAEVLQEIDPFLRDKWIGLEKNYNELLKRALDQIKMEQIEEDDIWECRVCNSPTFIIKDGMNTCYLCHNQENLMECEQCNELVFEDEVEEVYTGNYKRRHSYSYVCKSCISKEGDPNSEFY